MVFKTLYLHCTCKGPRFSARDAHGIARKGAATVRQILAEGVPQKCPHCGTIVNKPK